METWEEATVRADFLVDTTNGDRRVASALWLVERLQNPTLFGYTYTSRAVDLVSLQILKLLPAALTQEARVDRPRKKAIYVLRLYLQSLGYHTVSYRLSHILESLNDTFSDSEGLTPQSELLLRDTVFHKLVRVELGCVPKTLADVWDVYFDVRRRLTDDLGAVVVDDCLEYDVRDTLESIFYTHVDGVL